ncbi:Auxin-responsive protein IAA26 [Bienertia sinuspersici]
MSESCPKLLDLISKDKEKMLSTEERRYGSSSSASDENKLELRLGLPGDGNWSAKNNLKSREREDSLLSLGYFPSKHNNGGGVIGCVQEQSYNPWSSSSSQKKQQSSPYLQNHQNHDQYKTCKQQTKGLPVMGKDSSQPCCTRIVELQTAEKKAFSPPSANTAVPNSSQKRAAPAPVVGWPPIRSSRKNLASSSSGKAVPEPQTAIPGKPVNEKPANDNSRKGLFVKINMDGVPIGRKVDLSAYKTMIASLLLSTSFSEGFLQVKCRFDFRYKMC